MRPAVLGPDVEQPQIAVGKRDLHRPAVVSHLLDLQIAALGYDLVYRAVTVPADFNHAAAPGRCLAVLPAHQGQVANRLLRQCANLASMRGCWLTELLSRGCMGYFQGHCRCCRPVCPSRTLLRSSRSFWRLRGGVAHGVENLSHVFGAVVSILG